MNEYRMIDSKDFADFVSGFVSFLKNAVTYLIASLKEYFKTAMLLFLLIIVIGLFFWHQANPWYESTMVCSFREPDKKTYGEIVHNLDILAKDHAYNELAKQLNIQPSDAQCIISIEGKNRVGSMLYEDITPDHLPLYFYVKATDRTVFPILEPALINYLNTAIPALTAKLKRDSVDVSAKIQDLNKNIAMADSILAANYERLKKVTPLTDTNISASKLTSLLKYKSDMEAQLIADKDVAATLNKPVEILHGFTPSDKPYSDKDKILKLTITASLLLSCGAAILQKAFYDGRSLRTV